MEKTGVGIVGVGAISGIYLQNLTKTFKEVYVVGVCDLIPERAEKVAEEYKDFNFKIYKDMHALFADPKVDIVLNLTRPYEHFDVTKAALLAGKHVYSEKSLGASLEEGLELYKLAKEKGLTIGGAPDTFLGAGLQTCRKLIDDDMIGTPVAAQSFYLSRGHETWHPDPAFYYQFGAGPMLDMGPYYVTALVSLLGSVANVSGMTGKAYDTRTITSEPHYGTVVDVDVATHLTGTMRFESGVMCTITASFDCFPHKQLPYILIFGSKGNIMLPDPNYFEGPVMLKRTTDADYHEIPLLYDDYSENSRGLGVADMAKALRTGRKPRCHMDLTMHVLEVLSAFQRSSDSGTHIQIESRTERPAPRQFDMMSGILD